MTEGASVDGTYRGDWRDDRPHGQGTKTYEDGSRYEGAWERGERHGEGVLSAGDGRVIYSGEWIDGRRSGSGVFRRDSGLEYRGSWFSDLPQGTGELKDPEAGQDYVGKFDRGRLSGTGHVRLTRPSALVSYTGSFNDGRASDRGTTLFRGGRSYTGEFSEGLPNGSGVALEPGGEMTFGSWTAGRLDGDTYRVTPDGRVFRSRWAAGQRNGEEERLSTEATREVALSLGWRTQEAVQEAFEQVEGRFEAHGELGLLDPAYSLPDQWRSHQWLALASVRAAGDVLRVSEGPRDADNEAALALLGDCYELLRFAEGFSRGGFRRTVVVARDGLVSTYEALVEFVDDPKQVVDAGLELYEAVSSPEFTDTVARFVDERWQRFVNAEPEEKGDMVRSVVDELVAGAAGGGAIAALSKAVRVSRVALALRKLGGVARARSGEMLEAQLRFLKEGLGNRQGAMEVLARNGVAEASDARHYELLKRSLRIREVFDDRGQLTPDALAGSRLAIPGDQLNNQAVIRELTRDGSRIEDWGKFSTQRLELDGRGIEVHFYRNRATGAVNTEIDYKIVFSQL